MTVAKRDVFIIAEIGVNHNADLGIAYELIERSKQAGADAVKFQAAIPDLVVVPDASKADYQKRSAGDSQSQLDLVRSLHFPLAAFDELREFCDSLAIEFMCSAFDPLSLAYIEKVGVARHKIPSGEITNLPYLRQIAGFRRPTILSTGMSTLEEIDHALKVLTKYGLERRKITLLQCSTAYPTSISDANLLAMRTLGDEFGVSVGYSDHTLGILAPIAAAALGATVIEKHITLDNKMPGPDHSASLDPIAFGEMCASIRGIQSLLGSSEKRVSNDELNNMRHVRRSIVAKRPIKRGEIFDEDNIIAKRPHGGISPMNWYSVIGRYASRDFQQDEKIEI